MCSSRYSKQGEFGEICVVYESETLTLENGSRKDKEYCDFWLSKAEMLEACENELARRMDLLIERENEATRCEQVLDDVVEEHAQTLFREMKEKFFKTVAQALVKLKDVIAKVLGHILAFELWERVNVAINQEIDQL